MIGHYLLTLTPEQEDRLLTLPLGRYDMGAGTRCILEITGGAEEAGSDRWLPKFHPRFIEWDAWAVYERYDALSARFGDRLIRAIRNRILSNRARRILRVTSPLEAAHGPRTVSAS
jgi:hypothetical protein